MKKTISLFLTLFFVVSLVGCNITDKTENTTGEQITSADTSNYPGDAEENIEIREFPMTVNGAGENGKLTEAELPKRNLLTATDSLDSTYSIYEDKYPIHPVEGPKYELTDDDLTALETKLKTFLPYVFGDDMAKALEIGVTTETTFTEKCAVYGNVKAKARASLGLTLTISEYLIPDDEMLTAFSENEYVKIALDYLSFTDPYIADYSIDPYGSASYTICDGKASVSQDKEFVYEPKIYVHMLISYNQTLIVLNDYGPFENTNSSYNTVSYDAALNYLKVKNPDADMSTAVCEAVYDNTIYTGYFVPVYKIYIPDGNGEYTATRILAVDFDGEA